MASNTIALGTLSLYAALNTQTGEVLAKTSARHTSAEFVDFLAQIVASQPPGREIHVVVDNLSAHKTKRVSEFLEANPTVRIHYTPTYSSWVNQVEIWLSESSFDQNPERQLENLPLDRVITDKAYGRDTRRP